MLSLTCKTAIKAVIYLASKFDSGQRAGIKEIAEYINASEHTVGKFLQLLVKENIISSQKGPAGGFYINQQQINNPVVEIIYSIDGIKVFDECGLGLSKCAATRPCPIHDDYKPIREQFKLLCTQKKVGDLCDSVNNGLAYLAG